MIAVKEFSLSTFQFIAARCKVSAEEELVRASGEVQGSCLSSVSNESSLEA